MDRRTLVTAVTSLVEFFVVFNEEFENKMLRLTSIDLIEDVLVFH